MPPRKRPSHFLHTDEAGNAYLVAATYPDVTSQGAAVDALQQPGHQYQSQDRFQGAKVTVAGAETPAEPVATGWRALPEERGSSTREQPPQHRERVWVKTWAATQPWL